MQNMPSCPRAHLTQFVAVGELRGRVETEIASASRGRWRVIGGIVTPLDRVHSPVKAAAIVATPPSGTAPRPAPGPSYRALPHPPNSSRLLNSHNASPLLGQFHSSLKENMYFVSLKENHKSEPLMFYSGSYKGRELLPAGSLFAVSTSRQPRRPRRRSPPVSLYRVPSPLFLFFS